MDPTIANDALQLASQEGCLPNVDHLLQDPRMDPAAADNAAIRLASQHRHLPVPLALVAPVEVVARLLQDDRADPAAVDNEAILLASREGHLPIVDLLLQVARGDPAAADSSLRAIRTATSSRQGHVTVVDRLLQDPRVDPAANESNAGRAASHQGHVCVVDWLLQDVICRLTPLLTSASVSEVMLDVRP
jgi:hypothetical protein